MKVWDLEEGKVTQTLNGHQDSVRRVIKLKGNLIASCGFDGKVIVWDFQGKGPLRTFEQAHNNLFAISYVPEESVLLVGDGEGSVVVEDFLEGSTLHKWNKLEDGAINAMGYSPKGKTLLTCCESNFIKLWDFSLE